MPGHSRAWLERAIALATQLGFMDDVAQWKRELEQLEE